MNLLKLNTRLFRAKYIYLSIHVHNLSKGTNCCGVYMSCSPLMWCCDSRGSTRGWLSCIISGWSMRLFTRWLGASGPCDWVTSLLLSFLPVKKAWWVKPSGRSISQIAVARLSPRSTWWARRLNMTPVWPRWLRWATVSLATDLSPSPITGTQVNIMSSGLVSKQPYGSLLYTVVPTEHSAFHSTCTNVATFPQRVCYPTLSVWFAVVCLPPSPAC